MSKKSSKKSATSTRESVKTFKQVLADYKTGKIEARDKYLKLIKNSKFEKDTILLSLPNFILENDLKGGIEFIMEVFKKQNIKIEELTLLNAKKRLKKGRKLTHKIKSKTIFVPVGFSDRDYFTQLMFLQHNYKLFSYATKDKNSKINNDIQKSSLLLIVIAIKADFPHHLTENLYDRYKLSLEE